MNDEVADVGANISYSENGQSDTDANRSPGAVTHQELTTVPMDAASFYEVDVDVEGLDDDEEMDDGGRGGEGRAAGEARQESSEPREASEPRDSPGEANEDEEDDEDDEDEDDEAGEKVIKKCIYQGCTESTTQVAKQRKPWMCKKHRNKTYKEKYKKKKSVKAAGGTNKSDDDTEERPASVTKQRLSCMMTEHQTNRKASLLEQVLNQKRLSLLRSPEVVQFLQHQQRLLSNQAITQRHQQLQEAPI
ncbi:regulatory factor X-associated protein [Callorhinchus milii]|uniref:Regulatory factor X-associated protein n=2 Tax=Callorhinchus milii TaxID=7868 RepID=A0A4W3KFK5_CALMI|nr:regulatory factor X-associated protein [Callorhinchus milii]|eukprot:gi/632948166/ref/XP_007889442.1/ PREDICTED: regulatory factor X-associated protein [Callorhinchus milii]